MDDNLYDEFGNYIGPELDIEEDIDQMEEEEELVIEDVDPEQTEEDLTSEISKVSQGTISHSSAIVLHEDKKYYPSAEEVFGPGVETMVQDEDTQPLEEPIIKPIVTKVWEIYETKQPSTNYDKEFEIFYFNTKQLHDFVDGHTREYS
jgi:116 kDa U5 small nuclear ribonucleoprotein component